MYYVIQFATALILAVAANTGFSAFPVLAYNLAKDKYLPHMYMDRGDRLGYSNGILTLAIGSGVLIALFHGSTERLIPLYAVGVFIPFTLSQSGMIRHWWKRHTTEKGWLGKSFANFAGALISFAILVILFVYRLPDIWPFFIIMPLLVFVFYKIHEHYKMVAAQLRLPVDVAKHEYSGSTVIVLVGNVTRVTRGALNYAQTIGDYVIAMHVSMDENPNKEHETQDEFKRDFPDVRFVDVHSSYRTITGPTIRFVDIIAKNAAKRNFTTTVLIPQFVPKKPWQNILHNQTNVRLRTAFASRENVIIATYSYHLKR